MSFRDWFRRTQINKNMINENDLVALLVQIPEKKLTFGDVGTVAFCYESGNLFEVEFVNAKGETIAVETLTKHQIKKVAMENMILHVRELVAVA